MPSFTFVSYIKPQLLHMWLFFGGRFWNMDSSIYPLSTHGCFNGVRRNKGIRKGDSRKIYNFSKYVSSSKILNQQFWGTLKFPDTNADREWGMFLSISTSDVQTCRKDCNEIRYRTTYSAIVDTNELLLLSVLRNPEFTLYSNQIQVYSFCHERSLSVAEHWNYTNTVKPVLNWLSRYQNIFPLKPGFRLIKVHYIKNLKIKQCNEITTKEKENKPDLRFQILLK